MFCLRNKGIRLQLAVGEKRRETKLGTSLRILLKEILALPLLGTCDLGCEEQLRLFRSLHAVERFNDLWLF